MKRVVPRSYRKMTDVQLWNKKANLLLQIDLIDGKIKAIEAEEYRRRQPDL